MQLSELWKRNGSWVIRRYDLREEDVEVLQELGVVPLPSGEVLVPPTSLVEIVRRLKRIEGLLLRTGKRVPKEKESA